MPHGGRQLSWFHQQISHRGRCMVVCGRDERGGAMRDGGSTSLPSFRSHKGGETLHAAINHYMATSARLQWWGWLFCYAIAVSKSPCLEGSSTPAYKGTWRGHHGGIGVDTIWSPRLSHIQCCVLQGNLPWAYLRIRHKLLRPVPPWAFDTSQTYL
jgi:hypothetical protein